MGPHQLVGHLSSEKEKLVLNIQLKKLTSFNMKTT